VTRTRRTGTTSLVVALAVAAIAAGSATAATSMWIDVHARLSPVAGTRAAGKFSGVLVELGPTHGITPGGTVAIPAKTRWRLTWNLTLPTLHGPTTTKLRFGSGRSPRVLYAGRSTKTRGIAVLSARQARSIAKADAVVVVRTRSATLRGPVKVEIQSPITQG
jgi:hypothetical protein